MKHFQSGLCTTSHHYCCNKRYNMSRNADTGECSILVLVDLSGACDITGLFHSRKRTYLKFYSSLCLYRLRLRLVILGIVKWSVDGVWSERQPATCLCLLIILGWWLCVVLACVYVLCEYDILVTVIDPHPDRIVEIIFFMHNNEPSNIYNTVNGYLQ